MKKILRSLVFILLVLFFSCEKTGLFIVECDTCTDSEPAVTGLDIRLDVNDFGLARINIYEGNIEDSIIFASFRAGRSSSVSHIVPINKKYTVTATYDIEEKRYIAVDAAFPRVKYDEDSCEEACYYVYDRILDLRLKYTK